MRAALAVFFGLIVLWGTFSAHRRGQVPFDRHLRGPRSKDEAPGWYWSMLLLYGVGGIGLLMWGIRELLR